jgi:hypothetical protein
MSDWFDSENSLPALNLVLDNFIFHEFLYQSFGVHVGCSFTFVHVNCSLVYWQEMEARTIASSSSVLLPRQEPREDQANKLKQFHSKNLPAKYLHITHENFSFNINQFSILDVKHLERVCYHFKLTAISSPPSFICANYQSVKSPCTEIQPLNNPDSEKHFHLYLFPTSYTFSFTSVGTW